MRLSIGPESLGTRGTGRVLLSLGALMALVMIPASAVTNLTGEYSYTTSTDPLAISAVNSNTASGASGIQANSYGPGGKGVFGYSDASGSPGFGLAGISQNGYGVYGSSYGSGITAIYGENLSSGVGIGVQGASANGTGVYGVGNEYGLQGQSNNNCSSGSCPEYAGVEGIDNAGSYPGAFGVVGTAKYNHTGVAGFGSAGLGMYAYSNTGQGLAVSTGADGSGEADLGMTTGEGGAFYGFSGNTAHPALTAVADIAGTDLIAGYGASGQENFVVQYGSLDRSGVVLNGGSDVQVSGDLFVYGKVFQDCDAFPAVHGTTCFETADGTLSTNTAGRQTVRTYTPQQTSRTVEDFGEGQMVNGQGYVTLGSTFASTISRTTPYLVFITPEGDSHGLFVTGKSLTGFAVHDSMGGHSTLAFQYRILAHPYSAGADAAEATTVKMRPASVPHSIIPAHILKGHSGITPPSIGARVTRPPHTWVQNLHRQ